jgi:hypothetical protein
MKPRPGRDSQGHHGVRADLSPPSARSFAESLPGRGAHRFARHEIYCSRCGVHVAEAAAKKCMPSNVRVLVRR